LQIYYKSLIYYFFFEEAIYLFIINKHIDSIWYSSNYEQPCL